MKIYTKIFDSTEDFFSAILGLAIVLLVSLLIFNYFRKRGGMVDLPGVRDIAVTKVETKKVSNGTIEDYIVKKGDGLWNIAQSKFGDGDRWTELAKLNQLSPPYILYVGQTIKVSNEVKMAENNIDNSIYVVKKGDSLSKISMKLYKTEDRWQDIWNKNKENITNPNMLFAGTQLVLPTN